MLKHLKQRNKMKGGTIFGKSTRMRMQNPLRFPSMSQENEIMIERWLKQRMKGGTIFGKSTRMRMRYPWMNPYDYQVDPNWLARNAIKRKRR